MRTRDTVQTLENLHANCARNYAAYKAIHECLKVSEMNNFWRVSANSAYDMYVIDWCKLFGSLNDTTHHRNCSERGVENIRQLLDHSDVSAAEWAIMNEHFRHYRNNDVAHSNLTLPDSVAPYLEKSLSVLVISYKLLAKQNQITDKCIESEVSDHYALTQKIITQSAKGIYER